MTAGDSQSSLQTNIGHSLEKSKRVWQAPEIQPLSVANDTLHGAPSTGSDGGAKVGATGS